MLYRIWLFSVKPQQESATGIHISPSFWTSLPSPSHPTPLGSYRAPVWVSLVIQHIPVGYFTYSNINCHATLSIHLTLASPLHIPLIFLGKYIKWGFLVFVIFFFSIWENCGKWSDFIFQMKRMKFSYLQQSELT